MTDTQKQCLLTFLGYDTGGIGNGWGPKSKSAMMAFCRDFGGIDEADGPQALKHAVAYGLPERDKPSTGTFWDEIEYFTREEFKCKCGGKYCNGYPAEPKEQLVRIADQLRKNLGVPITIVSGLRCKEWNRIQKGVATSQHMYGEAADIWAQGKTQAQVEAELDRIGGVRYHYAIDGSSNVHFDIPMGER